MPRIDVEAGLRLVLHVALCFSRPLRFASRFAALLVASLQEPVKRRPRRSRPHHHQW